MPIMQFSYFPWNYAPATALIAKNYAVLHKALEGYLFEQAHQRQAPLMRSLWYDYPHQPDYYSIADEFLLGSDILVAPVMNEYCVARDIVLPPGQWRDAWTGTTYEQGTILQHPAPCPGIPLFVRAERGQLFESLNRVLATFERGTMTPGVISATYACGLDRDLSVTG